MARWTEWANRLRYLRLHARIDEDVDQEVRFHLDTRIADLEAAGLTPEAARRQAHHEFGSILQSREDSRAAWQFRWFEDARADLRYALRTFRRSPGFVITAVLSLALGIGATSAIFTALDAALWRPLPIADPDSLVSLSVWRADGYADVVPRGFLDQLEEAGTFRDIIQTRDDGLSFMSDGDGARAERIVGEAVTPNYFTALGVQPILGAGFSPGVQRGEWAAEAVLSYRFWMRRFAGDPTVIGRTIRLNTYPFTIVGVSPPAFSGLARGADYQLRIPVLPTGQNLPQIRLIGAAAERPSIARLAPGSTLQQAEAAANAQLQQFLRTTAMTRYREGKGALRAMRMQPAGAGSNGLLRPFQSTLYVLLILAVTVLAIACVNVASLLLARATARTRELAVRMSIGAGRWRVVRQMLAESLLLALLGSVVSLGIANWSTGLLTLFLPQGHLGIALDLGLDRRVLIFTFAISLLTAFAFGLLPALQVTRGDLASALKDDAAGATGAAHGTRTRRVLVVSQVSFSIVLLIATGVFLRTLGDLRPADFHIDPTRVLLFTMKPQQEIYTPARKLVIANELLRRVSQLTGVQSAALAEFGPLGSRTSDGHLQIPGRTVEAQLDSVTPGFFDTVGIPRIAGRDFTMNDRPGSPFVTIISRSLARALFDDQNPLGRTLTIEGDRQPRTFEVIGIVADTHYYDVHAAPPPTAWFAFQADGDLYMPTLHVRSATADIAGLAAAVRGEFDRIDTGFPVFNIKTLEVRVEEAMARERMIANISAGFGVLALLLAAVGLYGILAYSVVRRRREIGIRIALGSTSRSIVAMVTREGLMLVGIGTLAGIIMAWAGFRLLARYLPGVSALDLPIILACGLTMVVIALAAVCVPAARACRVDPLIALRQP
jgi:macrolide transport system ATP-binding/permease protein